MTRAPLLLLLLSSILSFGQTTEKVINKTISEIEAQVKKNNLKDAVFQVNLAFDNSPKNVMLNFLSGKINVLSHSDYQLAADRLNFSLKNGGPSEGHLFLAEAYYFLLQFDSAVKHLEAYKVNHNEADFPKINRMIEQYKLAAKYTKNPELFSIKNIGSELNSVKNEHRPIVLNEGKTIYFSSNRRSADYDPYVSKFNGAHWSFPDHCSDLNPQKACEILSVSTFETGFIYGVKSESGENIIYSKYYSEGEWSNEVMLNENVNSKYDEPDASITKDEFTLYFSSNRKGGYGGYDLYKVQKLPNGQWGLPINLGPTINTESDERCPFIHPNQSTLYFSSNGHPGMGGFDIFMSELADDHLWSSPHNLGSPLNTIYDNLYFSISDNGKIGYFSNYNNEDNLEDLFRIDMVSGVDAMEVISCKVFDESTHNPVSATITLINEATHDLNGIYQSNAGNGKFILLILPEYRYHIIIEAEGYLSKTVHLAFPYEFSYLNQVQNFTLKKE